MEIDLPDGLFAKLEEKARQQGVLPVQYLVSTLTEVLDRKDADDYEVSGFADENDTPISHEEAAPMIPGVLRGLEDVAAGRTRPATDVFRDLEIKYSLGSGK